MTKAELARRVNRSPGRISQWLREGKISGDAVVTTPGGERIDLDIAVAQLHSRLDPAQISLDDSPPSPAPVPTRRDNVVEFNAERAAVLSIDRQRKEIELAQLRGEFLDKADAADAVFTIFAGLREAITREGPQIAMLLGLTPDGTAALLRELRRLQQSIAADLLALAASDANRTGTEDVDDRD